MSDVLQNAAPDVEKLLLGSKYDMSDLRVVSRERGQFLADELDIKFLEISAKTGFNVEEVQILYISFCSVKYLYFT